MKNVHQLTKKSKQANRCTVDKQVKSSIKGLIGRRMSLIREVNKYIVGRQINGQTVMSLIGKQTFVC